MSVVENLLTVQEYDTRIRSIRKEMKDIPERKKDEQTRLNHHRDSLAESETSLQEKQAEQKEIELEIQSVKEKISKLRQQQLEIKTNKEFKAIESEIKGLEGQISALEDKELLVMEDLEQGKSVIQSKQGDLKSEEGAIAADVKELDDRLTSAQADLSELEKKRNEAAQHVDADWLERYEMIASRRDLALVMLKNGICGGCHMAVPRQKVHNARKHTQMVTCDQCGRLLY